MDQRIAFNERPVSLELPELDRLRGESLEARRATQTAGFTGLAMPILISGRSYRQSEIKGASRLDVIPEDSAERLDWADEHTVFQSRSRNGSQRRDRRLVSSLLPDFRQTCWWIVSRPPPVTPAGLCCANSTPPKKASWRMTGLLFRLQLENIKDIYRFDGLSGSEILKDAYLQSQQQQEYFQIRDHAYTDARRSAHRFPDAAFSRLRTCTRSTIAGGGISRWIPPSTTSTTSRWWIGPSASCVPKLETAGLWDRTSLLITADHGFRPDMWRGRYGWTQNMERISAKGASQLVPFILKLAGKARSRRGGPPFFEHRLVGPGHGGSRRPDLHGRAGGRLDRAARGQRRNQREHRPAGRRTR